MAAWSVIFLKNTRKVSPWYFIIGGLACLRACYALDYQKYYIPKFILFHGFNVLIGAGIGVFLYRCNFKAVFDFLYIFSNTMSLYMAAT